MEIYEWSGTATELLTALGIYASDDVKRSKAWPGGPQALSRPQRRLAPALRAAGYEYLEGEEGHNKKKVKTLRRIKQTGKESAPAALDRREEWRPVSRRPTTRKTARTRPTPTTRYSRSATPSPSRRTSRAIRRR